MSSRILRTPILASLVAGAAALLAGPASAQPCSPEEVAKLLAADGAGGDQLGNSVSVLGDVAVIGAYEDNDNGMNSGSAYIYRFDGTSWTQEAKLLPADGVVNDRFGISVSISGNVAIIGAHNGFHNGARSGSAYVFRYDGTNWTEEVKLLAADRAPIDRFGISVSVSGDIAMIGAYLDDDKGNMSGSVYVYRYDGTNWAEEAKLLPADGAAGDQFGFSVSISDDVAVIGAYGDSDNGVDSGSAYIYRYDGASWAEEAKLLAADGATVDYFGTSVSISDDVAVIGARLDDDNGLNSGSAYIFRYDGANWTEEAKLLATDGAATDLFGYSVSVSGDTAVIGSRRDDDNGTDSGSAYIYRYDGTNWEEQAKQSPADGAANDQFGSSVSVSGDTALIGARQDNDNGNNSGSAYIFNLNCTAVCLADVNGDGLVTPTDFTAWINAFNNNLPECDQNNDGSCTPTDFTAWIANFNAGC